MLQLCIAVGLTSWFSLHHGQKAVNAFAVQLRDKASEQVLHHLEDLLALPNSINKVNTDLYQNQYLEPDNFDKLGHFFWHQMNLFDVGYINYANAQGDFIGVERLPNNQLLINEQSQRTGNKLNSYETNQQGDRIRLLSSEPDEDPRLEAWYVNAVQAGKPIWSQIYSWQDKPDIWSISSSYPLYDQKHQLQGVIGVDLILSDLNHFLQDTTASPCGKTFIIERDGLLVASSADAPPIAHGSSAGQRIAATQSQDPLLRAIAQKLLQRYGSWQAVEGKKSMELQVNREREYVQITPWYDPMGLDWLVVVVVPESDFMGEIYASTQKTVLLSLLSLALATLLGLITARWIGERLRRLVEASQAIAHGDLEQNPNVRGIRELDLLARAFNQMAATLKESFQHLERRVEQRTAELAAAKDTALEEATRSADANRAKSEFLATMSHELRTPLNVILGFVQVMQHDLQLRQTHQEHLDTIQRSGEHLLSLINDVLKASKLEGGRVSLQTSSFDLHHLLDTLYRMMQLRAGSKGLCLKIDCASEVPHYIHTDANKLRQVLINLLDNAIKFTEMGNVTLRVWDAAPDKHGTYLSFAVEDTGPGIQRTDLPMLFEPFVQTKTGRQSHQGTGLGLYISHRFVRLMGGELTCESEVNQRTCFQFTIPICPAQSPMGSDCKQKANWVTAPLQPSETSDRKQLNVYLKQMPPDWIAQLHEAAVKGFDHAILQLVEQIPDMYSPLAYQLAAWAIEFQFDPVIALIQETSE